MQTLVLLYSAVYKFKLTHLIFRDIRRYIIDMPETAIGAYAYLVKNIVLSLILTVFISPLWNPVVRS